MLGMFPSLDHVQQPFMKIAVASTTVVKVFSSQVNVRWCWHAFVVHLAQFSLIHSREVGRVVFAEPLKQERGACCIELSDNYKLKPIQKYTTQSCVYTGRGKNDRLAVWSDRSRRTNTGGSCNYGGHQDHVSCHRKPFRWLRKHQCTLTLAEKHTDNSLLGKEP